MAKCERSLRFGSEIELVDEAIDTHQLNAESRAPRAPPVGAASSNFWNSKNRSKCDSSSGELEQLRIELTQSLRGYGREWKIGFERRMFYVASLMVCACLVPALVFGTWLCRKTKGGIGTAEVFMSAFVSGSIFIVFGKQPLVIVGVAAPSVVFVTAVSSTADRLSVAFLPWLGWIGIWCSGVLMLLAYVNACRAAHHLSSFTWEVLQAFIGLTLLWDGVEAVVEFFRPQAFPLDTALLSLWLATCAWVMAVYVSGAVGWEFFSRRTREAIQLFGPGFTLLLLSVLPLLPQLSRPQLPKVDLPNLPYRTDRFSRFGGIVQLTALPVWAICLAFIPGSLLAGLIFFDHNSASLLVQEEAGKRVYNYRSRSWDLFVIASSVLLCSFFGLPFSYGLARQSVAHVQALTSEVNAGCDVENQQQPEAKVQVQRVSAMIVALCWGILLLPGFVHVLRKIPQGVLAGIFLQMSWVCLNDLKLTARLKSAFKDPSNIPAWEQGCHLTVCVYSVVQLSCVATVFAVSKTAAALLFPLFLLVTIWLRHDVLHNFFSKRELLTIDKKLLEAEAHSDPRHHPAGRNSAKGVPQSGPQSLRKLLRDKMSAPVSALTRRYQVESESARSCESPALLTVPSRRRLKERSRRRRKRKMSHGPSSLETTSSSNVALPQSSYVWRESSSLKKQKSGEHQSMASSNAYSPGAGFNGSSRGRGQQQVSLNGRRDGADHACFTRRILLSPLGESLSSKAPSPFKRASGGLNSRRGSLKRSLSSALTFSTKPESPNISVTRRTFPSPFRQASPRSDSQMLRANSLYDPHWKDFSPPSMTMQVHQNLAFLAGEAPKATYLGRSEDIWHPPTLRFCAPMAPSQPLGADVHRAWEVSASSRSSNGGGSCFRLLGEALEDGCTPTGSVTRRDECSRQAWMRSSSMRSERSEETNHVADADVASESMRMALQHGWEGVNYSGQGRPSRFKLASEEVYGETTSGTDTNMEVNKESWEELASPEPWLPPASPLGTSAAYSSTLGQKFVIPSVRPAQLTAHTSFRMPRRCSSSSELTDLSPV